MTLQLIAGKGGWLLLLCAVSALTQDTPLTRVDISTCLELAQGRCKPCEGGVDPYSLEDTLLQLEQLSGWELLKSKRGPSGKAVDLRIRQTWRAKNFATAMTFLNQVAKIAEEEGHHPNVEIKSYRTVTVELTTHAIKGLSENDFIMAAKISQLPIELKEEEGGSRQQQSSTSPPPAPAPAPTPAPSSSSSDSHGSGRAQGRLLMLAGMIASGKSTFANQLIAESSTPTVVFSPDDWVLKIYGLDFPVERFQEVGDKVKDVIWDTASQLVRAGGNAILDFSFWQKDDRQTWRDKAQGAGLENVHTYFVHCHDKEEVRRRIVARNARVRTNEDIHFQISLETYEGWASLVEVPTAEEKAVIINTCH